MHFLIELLNVAVILEKYLETCSFRLRSGKSMFFFSTVNTVSYFYRHEKLRPYCWTVDVPNEDLSVKLKLIEL